MVPAWRIFSLATDIVARVTFNANLRLRNAQRDDAYILQREWGRGRFRLDGNVTRNCPSCRHGECHINMTAIRDLEKRSAQQHGR